MAGPLRYKSGLFSLAFAATFLWFALLCGVLQLSSNALLPSPPSLRHPSLFPLLLLSFSVPMPSEPVTWQLRRATPTAPPGVAGGDARLLNGGEDTSRRCKAHVRSQACLEARPPSAGQITPGRGHTAAAAHTRDAQCARASGLQGGGGGSKEGGNERGEQCHVATQSHLSPPTPRCACRAPSLPHNPHLGTCPKAAPLHSALTNGGDRNKVGW